MIKRNKTFLFFLISVVLILTTLPSFSQSNGKGEITKWELINIPHGVSIPGKYYKTRWEIINLDVTGGHIKAKLWSSQKPQCDAYADFKWNFITPVKEIYQDQKIWLNLSVSSNSSSKCKAPTDPGLEVFVMSGRLWDKKIGGDISDHGKDLMGYGSLKRGHRVRADVGPRNIETYLVVNDRTSAGYDVDAKDGGFGFGLSWRGNNYEVFYKYRPRGLLDDSDDDSSDSGAVEKTGIINPKTTLQIPVIEHNKQNSEGTFWMSIKVPGTIQGYNGKQIQLVIRFVDEQGNFLSGNSYDFRYVDGSGKAATGSALINVKSYNFDLGNLQIWMPYYALNLPDTGGRQIHNIRSFAELYVDGKMLSQSPYTSFQVRW